jgi:hypothetical protein
MALIEMPMACVAVFLYIVLNHHNVTLLIILGSVPASFPFIAGIAVMREISPFVCSMAINMEPVYPILLALWLYGQSEFKSLGLYLGGRLIILTTFACSLIDEIR